MLDQVKSSLHEFQSRDKNFYDSKGKQEYLVANVKKVLIAEGWKKPPQRRRSYSDSATGGVPRNSSLGEDEMPLKCFSFDSEFHVKDKCDKDEKKKDLDKDKKGTKNK